MSSNLQGMYVAALSRIGSGQPSGNDKRSMPIFQRKALSNTTGNKDAVREAANALSALWRSGEAGKR